jgi:hypothetical protein
MTLGLKTRVARGQARLFGVAGLNTPGSVSTSLSDLSEQRLRFLNLCLWCYHPCVVFHNFFQDFIILALFSLGRQSGPN